MGLNEVSCRNSNLVIQYFKKNAPQLLPTLLEGYDEQFFTDELNWMSYQTTNQLYGRAEKLLGIPNAMVHIGRDQDSISSLGVIDLLVKLIIDPASTLSMAIQYTNLLTKVSRIEVLDKSSHHIRLEVSNNSGFIRTRGACDYVKGLYYGLLESKDIKKVSIVEESCAVPIWEKGCIQNSSFSYRKKHVWKKDLKTGKLSDLGMLEKDGTFKYDKTVYGARNCIYRIEWSRSKSLKNALRKLFPWSVKIIEGIRLTFLHDYENMISKNQNLVENNVKLAEMLNIKEQENSKLQAKINKRNNELEDSLKQLQDLDVMKSYFLSITSHELRTPLTIVKGALNLIQNEKEQLGPERFDKYLTMAQRNAERLILLLDDLLDLSRLESGQMKLELDNVDLVRLIREATEEFREEGDKRDLIIESSVEENPPWIIGDPARIKQILNNLISNALKFTPPEGKISISMKSSASAMEIEVSDTGMGIDPSEQETIFSKFHQGNYTLTREKGGVGLGLAIVKDLVQLHGGRIWVKSETNKGSTFHVKLPLNGPNNPEQVAVQKTQEKWAPPKVLKTK